MRLAIGDVHGRVFWKHYLEEDFSEFYILGDYFDSYRVSFTGQYRNFQNICKAAREDSRIRLCLGNHDYHYLGRIFPQQYSGFQDSRYDRINGILEDNIDLLRVLYLTGDGYILSHAGVSAAFIAKLRPLGIRDVTEIDDGFNRDRNILSFDGIDNTGDDITQSPIWIRPRSLLRSPLRGYSQIVGHTPVYRIGELPFGFRDKQGHPARLIQIDTGDYESVYRF